ncbi:ABC transporter permease [Lederbergia wuyishanensis]|uniref:ABC transporter permease n=1 Tax=Lederbergia wuyishanensis TaxID=1347903 RepID=UPI001FD15AC9|nr:ABC transporter permease subunit [Lederbergia wuyishanensis]MCJ8009269.1 ABC transporter permease [Lederbergia wuyishanensis]
MELPIRKADKSYPHSFWVLVQKEVSDHILSWRVNILVILLALTCFGSLYTALSGIRDAAESIDANDTFLFLKLFTISDGTLPPFFVFVSFIGPLLGIALGFDAINSEYSKGTLSRVVSQPIPRDYIINAKFVAAILVISALLFSLGFLVLALGILMIGIPPTPDEFLRVISFLVLSVCYIAFWVNLSILFSIRFKQAATSALSSIAVWLFFSIFYSMIVNLISKASESQDARDQSTTLIENLMRISPSQLFSEATTILLTPSVRTLGPLTMEQVVGAIPGALPLSQSLLLITPQLIALIAATLICFGISYALFMRKEIRN